MLGDYEPRGGPAPLLPQHQQTDRGEEADVVARFQTWLRTADRAASTVRT